MSDQRTASLLSEMLSGLVRSMPQYVAECWPWTHRDDADAHAVIKQIIDEEQQRAQAVAQAILAGGGTISYPSFPDWTRLNFVALDYLLDRMVQHQEAATVRFQALCDQLPQGTEARALAESVVEDSKKHLEQIRGLAKKHPYPQQGPVVIETISN